MSIEETLYRLNRDTNGAIRLNLSMQTALLDQLDRAARSAGYTRSGFIAQAVREKLASNERREAQTT